MIVWIASYPRTGSKLVRTFLYQVFGLPNFLPILYKPKPSSERWNDKVGTSFIPGTFEEFYLHARRSDQGFLIKTHYPPIDDSPAIVMAREGRATLISYYHYLIDKGHSNVTLPKIIQGEMGIGSWSRTLEDWNPLKRPGTLLLRFEDILSSPDKVTELVADFLSLTPLRKWENPFDQMRKVSPLQYRQGDNRKNQEEFSQQDEAMFWQAHRDWMQRLGYCDPAAPFGCSMTSQVKDLPERWLSFAETNGGAYQIPESETLQYEQFREGEAPYKRLFEMERELADLRQQLTLPKKRSWILPWKRRPAA